MPRRVSTTLAWRPTNKKRHRKLAGTTVQHSTAVRNNKGGRTPNISCTLFTYYRPFYRDICACAAQGTKCLVSHRILRCKKCPLLAKLPYASQQVLISLRYTNTGTCHHPVFYQWACRAHRDFVDKYQEAGVLS